MELRELGTQLLNTFTDWKSDPANPKKIDAFQKQLDFAGTNGIDLVLTVSRNERDRWDSQPTRPMSTSDASEYGYEAALPGNRFVTVFSVTSEMNMRNVSEKDQNTLKVVDSYRNFGPVLFLNNKRGGTVGIFLPNEIDSTELK